MVVQTSQQRQGETRITYHCVKGCSVTNVCVTNAGRRVIQHLMGSVATSVQRSNEVAWLRGIQQSSGGVGHEEQRGRRAEGASAGI